MADSEDTVAKTQRTSPDVQTESLDRLREVFPQFVKDGEIDFEALKEFFANEGLLVSDEKYGLGWAGKSDAFRLIREPATGTLTPKHEESKNWDNTENLFIEGDNLETLKLLQAHYREEVKMIYIDPPYNTGGDFIYRDNFHEDKNGYEERTGQRENGAKLMKNTENGGRHHSYWLTMMYPRLFLAKNLLKDDGVIFISIDDNEVHNLRHVMDEIFGEENFVAQVVVQTNPRGRTLDRFLAKTFEYMLVYAKKIEEDNTIYNLPKSEEALARYNKEDENGKYRMLELRNRNPVFNRNNRPNLFFPLYIDPENKAVSLSEDKNHTVEVLPLNSKEEEGCWTWSQDKVRENINNLIAHKTNTGAWRIFRKDYKQNSATTKAKALWLESEMNHEHGKEEMGRLFDKSPFDFPKSVELVRKCVSLGTSAENADITLDFFAGSAPLAHATLKQNAEDGGTRKWICVQIPEGVDEDSEAAKAGYSNIAQIARERIRRAGDKIKEEYPNELEKQETTLDVGFKSYTLADSNYRQWEELTEENTQEELLEQAKLFAEKPLVDEYDDESVVYEVLLKEGFGLNSEVKQEKMGELDVWVVNDDTSERRLVVTFAKQLTKDQIESLDLGAEDTFVCFDYALDDETKVNITRNLNVKVI